MKLSLKNEGSGQGNKWNVKDKQTDKQCCTIHRFQRDGWGGDIKGWEPI